MFSSDGRGQEENCNGRQLSCHFTWKIQPTQHPQDCRQISLSKAWRLCPFHLIEVWLGNRWKRAGKKKGRGRSLAVVQFKTMAGPSLPSHANTSVFSQLGSSKATYFLAQTAQNIFLIQWSLQISLFIFPPIYEAGRVDELGSAGNTGSKSEMCFWTSGHWEVLER